MTRAAGALIRAALVLIVGFAALALPFVQGFFDLVALGLTHVSQAFLNLSAFDLTRSGTELRDPVAGWAIRVTEVCDGHGIMIAWMAIVCAHLGPWRRIAWLAFVGFVAIQVFNFGRVIALAVVLDTTPGAFEDVHLFLFPLLTTGLLAGLGMLIRPYAVLVFLAAAFGVAVAWYFATETVSGAVLAPVAALIQSAFGPEAVKGIAGQAPSWVIETQMLVSRDPVQLLAMPFYPPDFAIALPVVTAAIVAIGQVGGVRYLVLWAAIAVVAMAIGMITAAWNGADAQGIRQVIVPQGAGRAVAVAYAAPSETLRGLTELVQNVLVHFNLLVLPVLILILHGRRSSL